MVKLPMDKSKYDQTLIARVLVAMNEINEPVKIKDIIGHVYNNSFPSPLEPGRSIGGTLRVLLKHKLVEKISHGVYQLASKT